jgi:SAM-dependent methyltransferase
MGSSAGATATDVEKLRMASFEVLNLGCGKVKTDFPEASRATRIVGIDWGPDSDADIVHDLNVSPLPVESNRFDLVILQDVVEHLNSLTAIMAEVYRVLKPGGIARIRTPHYSCFYAHMDPTHIRCYSSLVFQWFERPFPNNPYGNARFVVKRKQIQFPKIWRWCGVAFLANRFPERWDQFFAYVIRAENMIFELAAVKDS